MKNPTPGDGGDDTVDVSSNLPNSTFVVTAHYKTTTHQFPPAGTDSAGNGQFTFSIGRPTVGYTVPVHVDFSAGAHCETSFTPQ